MMRSVKKWLSGLLCLALLLTVLPTAAMATDVIEGPPPATSASGETKDVTIPPPSTEVQSTTYEDSATVTRAILADLIYQNTTLKSAIDAAGSGQTAVTFSDIGENTGVTDSQRTGINALAKARFISGTGDGKFSPSENVTREQVAVVFWRVTGSKQVPLTENLSFTDVSAVDPFAPAVAAMVSAGLASGYNDDSGKFGVGDSITVGQVNTLIGRYLGTVEGGTTQATFGTYSRATTRLEMLMEAYEKYKDSPLATDSNNTIDYVDIGACSDDEKEAIDFFTSQGLVSGYTPEDKDNPVYRFGPYDAASNLQAAVFLYQCATKFEPETEENQSQTGGDPGELSRSVVSYALPYGNEQSSEAIKERVEKAWEYLTEELGTDTVSNYKINPDTAVLANTVSTWTEALVPAAPTITETDGQITITNASTDTDAVIYYTTDGNEPTVDSTQYTGAFTPEDTVTTIRAVAVKNSLYSTLTTKEIPEEDEPEQPEQKLTITADPASLTGGGNVTLTVGSEPASAAGPEDVTVTCNVSGYTPTKGTDGKWSVTLPNETKDYTFTASADGYTSGTVTVKVTYKSTSSGNTGGSSSRPSNTTTTTERNPDGSTTTTTTNKTTGTVTETTRYPDGSQEVVETKKDGTVTTTTTDTDGNETAVAENPDGTREVSVEQADGTSASAVTDADGRTQAEVSLSSRAVSAAQEEGGAVALPIPGISVSGRSEAASLVEISLPRSAGEVKVKIPTENAGPGTVAVIVNEDGTETVVKKSLTLDGGLALTLETDATVKIVDNSRDFDDTYGHWAEDAIDFATAHEMFGGTSATTFSPDTPMTRGMLAVVLHRFEDTPNHTFTESFEDVAPGSWYADGIHWMADNGIVSGYGDGNFGANDSITREQLAAILYRYANVMGYGTSGSASLDRFSDVDSVSGYAVEAMGWAVGNGLIGGMGDGTLAPQGNATRAQVATILMRFVENLVQ